MTPYFIGFILGVATLTLILLGLIAVYGPLVADHDCEIPEDALGDLPNIESFGGVHHARKEYP